MKWRYGLLLFFSQLNALQISPWFGDVWEFYLDGRYALSTYSRIEHGVPKDHYTSWDQIATVNLGLSPLETWMFDVGLETAHTRAYSWSLRSCVGQASYLVFNDLAYDPISLAVGASLRYVTHFGLHDVSFPYHAPLQLEGFCSLGKEWTSGSEWTRHVFFWGAVGMGSRGMPWLHGILEFEENRAYLHTWGVSLDALVGLGGHKDVHTHHFPGYGNIQHRSLDVKGHYAIQCGLWGSFDVAYSCRVYAKSFPEYVQSLIFSYNLPFSLF